VTAAVREVARNFDWPTTVRFFREICDQAETEGDHLLVAELAHSLGRRDLAVILGQSAHADGLGPLSRKQKSDFLAVRIDGCAPAKGLRAQCSGGRSSAGSKLLFDFDNLTSHVVTAVRADHVRGHRGAALRAVGQLLGLLGVVGPPAARPGIRVSALGYGHGSSRLKLGNRAF
jgi:hypothetical protein